MKTVAAVLSEEFKIRFADVRATVLPCAESAFPPDYRRACVCPVFSDGRADSI